MYAKNYDLNCAKKIAFIQHKYLKGSPYLYIPYLLDCTIFEYSLPVWVVFAI